MLTSRLHKYLAELIGTALLTYMVSNTILQLLPPAVAAGLTLGLLVYVFGSISGAHMNPAVTVGMWSVGKISMKDAIAYIVAQCIGAALAMLKIRLLFGSSPSLEFAPAQAIPYSEFMGEAGGAIVLVLGVSSVVHGRASSSAAGIVIGTALLLGVAMASPFSLGVLNPAVALGIGAWNWMYFIAPVVGGVVGAWVYHWLSDREMAVAQSEA